VDDLLRIGAEDQMQFKIGPVEMVQEALKIDSSAGSGSGKDKAHFKEFFRTLAKQISCPELSNLRSIWPR
jgi:hypothetical protein